MRDIDDDEMKANLANIATYTLVLLKRGPHYDDEGANAIIWEHGRRNFQLRDAGKLAIVSPVGDPDLAGFGIFATDVDETTALMAEDPAVVAGVLVPEFYSARSFPGDTLP